MNITINQDNKFKKEHVENNNSKINTEQNSVTLMIVRTLKQEEVKKVTPEKVDKLS